MDLRCDFFEQAVCARAAASYRESDAAPKPWEIDQPRRLLIDTIVIDIFGNPHDDAPRPLGTPSDAFPKRIARLAPIFKSHVLRHDHHAVLAEQVVQGEVPASEQPCTERGK